MTATAADIYRCTGDTGEPVFSGRPCAEGNGVRVLLPGGDGEVGHGVRASESDWLAERAAKRLRDSKPQRSGSRRHDTGQDRQAYRCREKRR
jgi:hypothetical protein